MRVPVCLYQVADAATSDPTVPPHPLPHMAGTCPHQALKEMEVQLEETDIHRLFR